MVIYIVPNEITSKSFFNNLMENPNIVVCPWALQYCHFSKPNCPYIVQDRLINNFQLQYTVNGKLWKISDLYACHIYKILQKIHPCLPCFHHHYLFKKTFSFTTIQVHYGKLQITNIRFSSPSIFSLHTHIKDM